MLEHEQTLRAPRCVKQAHHKRTNTIWFHLHEAPRVVGFIRMKVEWWLPGAGGKGKGQSLLSGNKVSTEEEKVLEMDAGCTTG